MASMYGGLDWAIVINARDLPVHAVGQGSLFDVLYGITIPKFLAGSPIV